MNTPSKPETFSLEAVRAGNLVTVRGRFIAPSPGYTYTAATDRALARLPHMLGATINMRRPSRRLPNQPTEKAISFSLPDLNAEATHVRVLLSISGVPLKLLKLPITG